MGDGATFGFSNSATNYQGQRWGSATQGKNPWDANTLKEVAKDSGSAAGLNTFFQNWLTGGGAPKAIDPTTDIAQAYQTRAVSAQGAQGMGMGGLFGLGKVNMFSPLQPGVPSSTPAMPQMPGAK